MPEKFVGVWAFPRSVSSSGAKNDEYRHLWIAGILIVLLYPQAATGQSSDVLAAVETIGNQLRSVQDDDIGGGIPRDAQKFLPLFRRALRDYVAASIGNQPELSPNLLKEKLTRELESILRAVKDDQADLLVTTVTIFVKCGF